MNTSFNKVKATPNDELYTRIEDVEKEMVHYNFKGKWVYCPCDTKESAFFKFFYNNFKKLGLELLFCTSYNPNGNGKFVQYNGKDIFEHNLKGNGDFLSDEIMFYYNMADIVVTNPPFSKFRQFTEILHSIDKDYIIVGIEAACVYKNFFPYIKNGKVTTGHSLIKSFINEKGEIIKFGNICWWTNVNTDKKEWCPNREYSIEYPILDNYDAILINKVKDIPSGCDKVMAVPVSYISKHNPSIFEIVGVTSSSRENAGDYLIGSSTSPYLNGKRKFAKLLLRKVA